MAGNVEGPFKAVDDALAKWCQGDCVTGEVFFVHRFDPETPVEPVAGALPGVSLYEREERGLVVLTQTCDIRRRCEDRPYIEVAPLVEVDEGVWAQVEAGRRPAYAAVPSLKSRRLVADLDRVMTVEKPVVSRWVRVQGCSTDPERRSFRRALARKRARFPFPDDFNDLVKPLQDRIQAKHGRNSPDGYALNALLEIRVEAFPDWSAVDITLQFWFIRGADVFEFEGQRWNVFLERWKTFLKPRGRFRRVDGLVVPLAEMTAEDYVQSYRLDLDFLSSD